MMDFEEFILRQIVKKAIEYDHTNGRFVHSRYVDNPQVNEILQEEGKARNYTEDRIRRECEAVVNNMGQLLSRTTRNVVSFEVEDHLPLGGLVEVSGYLDQSPVTEMQTLILMRVNRDSFFVVESNRPDIVFPATFYRLKESTYLSTIKGSNPLPFIFESEEQQMLKLNICKLNFINPSTCEQALDSMGIQNDDTCEENNGQRLHPNPMALLLHDYSSALSHYIDITDGQPVVNRLGVRSISDISEFVDAVKTYIKGCVSESEVERKYLDWFQFCMNNHIAIMSLDTIVNKMWSIKGRL